MSKKSKSKQKKENYPILQNPYDKTIKLLIIGDAGVGKTSLITQYVTNIFSANYISTVGIDFKEKIIEKKDKCIRLQIWDTAGQERFHTITKAYYRGAHGLVVMFDLTDLDSFKNLQYWLQNIEENCDKKNSKIIVGGKADLIQQRKVKPEQIAAFCEQFQLKYIETSAKTGNNVEELFQKLTLDILVHHSEQKASKKKKMGLSSKLQSEKEKKCC